MKLQQVCLCEVSACTQPHLLVNRVMHAAVIVFANYQLQRVRQACAWLSC